MLEWQQSMCAIQCVYTRTFFVRNFQCSYVYTKHSAASSLAIPFHSPSIYLVTVSFLRALSIACTWVGARSVLPTHLSAHYLSHRRWFLSRRNSILSSKDLTKRRLKNDTAVQLCRIQCNLSTRPLFPSARILGTSSPKNHHTQVLGNTRHHGCVCLVVNVCCVCDAYLAIVSVVRIFGLLIELFS
jgi:hypothetical protein